MQTRKHTLVFLFTLVLGQFLFAQEPVSVDPVSPATTEVADIMTIGFGLAVLLVLAIALYTMSRSNRYLSKRVLEFEAEKHGVKLPVEESEVFVEGDDFWTKIRKKYWEGAVPIEQEGDITFDHSYDGIRELDNKLPPWWVNMFILSIIWAFGYMYYYHWSDNNWSSDQQYKNEMERAKKEVAMALAGKANAVDESNATVLTDASALGDGELIFKNTCAACHGQQGEGGVGPNFTDEYWIHGGGVKDLFRTIKYGVPEKGMISWQSQLKPSDIQKVASYILTLKGTNPPNQKEPQGVIWRDTTATGTPAPEQEQGE
ncbi:MAG: cbb3-type cytochrome c oxidase N-terminal domain-containing protein [Saprospiraceae bacterium]